MESISRLPLSPPQCWVGWRCAGRCWREGWAMQRRAEGQWCWGAIRPLGSAVLNRRLSEVKYDEMTGAGFRVGTFSGTAPGWVAAALSVVPRWGGRAAAPSRMANACFQPPRGVGRGVGEAHAGILVTFCLHCRRNTSFACLIGNPFFYIRAHSILAGVSLGGVTKGTPVVCRRSGFLKHKRAHFIRKSNNAQHFCKRNPV